MSFQKKKLPSSGKNAASKIIASYESVKRKNSVTAFLLGSIAILIIACIGSAVFASVSGMQFKFTIPNIAILTSPFSGKTDDGVFKGSDKVNILLTGVGGGVHDGAELTDTIILASLNKRSNTVSLFSLPRDLYVEFPTGGRGRINETFYRAYKHEEAAAKKSKTKVSSKNEEYASGAVALSGSQDPIVFGMTKLGEKITEITGEHIDYFVNVDFSGFSKFVDVLGGIQVNVPDDLVDHEYPDNNWGYQTFSIKKGLQTLDGDTALKYARSRHSTSDFDRSLRQQLIIRAIKDKLFSLGTLTSPSKLKALYDAVSSNIRTDLSLSDMLGFALFAKELPTANILSFNLNDSCFQSVSSCDRGGLLYTPNRDDFNGMAVLLPSTATASDVSNYTDISRFANLVINYPEIFLENIEINIINSTKSSGVANSFALYLKKYGFNVPEKYSVSSTKDIYTSTTVYYTWDDVLKSGIAPASKTLEALSLFVFRTPEPIPTTKYAKIPGPKIEIILAKDALNLLK